MRADRRGSLRRHETSDGGRRALHLAAGAARRADARRVRAATRFPLRDDRRDRASRDRGGLRDRHASRAARRLMHIATSAHPAVILPDGSR
ncbi:hypothetical protein BG60_00280 [Caballeronia zhejiangensis]|uniref:Uncharacterized protein n=1 Tax=Caballeronia zhejiangensis TaxID=871203 RepID=A0A656QS60_9BURK|nr:hypothetical protein BG60_00280 [Caballeronia zhejiangensis]